TPETQAPAGAGGTAQPGAPGPRWRGTRVGAPLIICLAVGFVVLTGLLSPQPMIGDEVTHYYMLVEQARLLPSLNYVSAIPTGWGAPELRHYSHPNAWHYLGACLYRLTGGSFAAIQFYQAFFLLQLLCVGYWLARSRGGVESRAALLYVLVLATLPMGLIFSVAFYQDVPMAAQALTAFYLLSRRRFVWSAFFLSLAVAIKVTGAVLIPPYLALLGYGLWKSRCATAAEGHGWRLGLMGGVCVALVVGALSVTAWSLQRYAGAGYYPVAQARSAVARIVMRARTTPAPATVALRAAASPRENVSHAVIIANHPGDLRRPVNYLVYGGVLLWIVLGLGLSAGLWRARPTGAGPPAPGGAWLWWVGGVYTVVTAYQLRTAPDARFFLPGLIFLLLPLVERAVRWPRSRTILAMLAAVAIFQGGLVLLKTHRLREVSPALQAAIQFLRTSPPQPHKVFMYPEGNYRLFPAPHEWYLGYRLREFWRGSNEDRLTMCHHCGVGALVIKKHLIRPVDEAITDLGCYPDYFVRALAEDKRFEKLFENDAVIIYRVPPPRMTRP
ncbi:MAG: glycosyltransferase family 87 protein, partial [Kiritimatiellaeota bacterium]|nr:glycosyltransferase family 87 protein [Kiritimatiellota bacterium]